MHKCPCCSEVLLRHARHGKVYLFCTHCWQEMPDLETKVVPSMRLSTTRRLQELVTAASAR